jgi:hypothetical protein
MNLRSTTWTLFALAIGIGMSVSTYQSSIAQSKKEAPPVIRSAQSGPWSAAATWEGGKTPPAGARVQVRTGHRVLYDRTSDEVIRSIHVAGTLAFAHDRDTRLDVGLINIQPGEQFSEDGFDCDGHGGDAAHGPRPALEVGSPDQPVEAKHTALIRLTYFDGLDKKSCPAIVCCGGRMDFHGTPMNRTWLKLGATAKKGATFVKLTEAVTGWKIGDRVIVTTAQFSEPEGGTRRPGRNGASVHTEVRTIKTLDGAQLTLDEPLSFDHNGEGDYRAAVANLSRNVVVEGADLKQRGHTMYHHGSAGSISYAEFRHLGMEGQLGRYALHFHLAAETMRGSYVIGASIWDSANRWLTIHGTQYLIVRDCVGYQSVGHGFFLEDGTEVYNVLDRNLAVQAFRGKPLPKQVLPFDHNEGAGFWWANSLNTFTNNVTCENDRYGYRFEATQSSYFNLTLPILQPDGTKKPTDIRTLPFVRFDDNESISEGLYGFNLGEGVNRVGPDRQHPFIIRNMKLWGSNYAFRPQSPSVLTENMLIYKSNYGIYHPNYDNHVYKNLRINGDMSEPFNRGHDDQSVQYGIVAVDGLTFDNVRGNVSSIPLIQMTDNNATGKAETHIRNLTVANRQDNRRPVANIGGGAWSPPKTAQGVPVYLHDYFGEGRHAKLATTTAKDLLADGNTYREEKPLTGAKARVAEVKGVAFPQLLDPIDDLPPTTVITHLRSAGGKLVVRGTTADNGTVTKVLVNGHEARATSPGFHEWEIVLDLTGSHQLSAHAEDAAGNIERRPHVLSVVK